MARAGMYKSDVKKARDSLVAQAQYPSIDAVRMALGNTGSKTTIHKYLKELEEEEGGVTHQTSVSDALLDLVERLATRLQEEANESTAQAREELARVRQENTRAHQQLSEELRTAQASATRLQAQLEEETTAHAKTRAAHQAETVARHTAEQQVSGLKDRLAENEQHRQSLEEKHSHAREALEHYRRSVKEQREQDQRRHEQQVQQLQAELRGQQLSAATKQDEVTRLNQEGAKLVTELSHTKQSLYEQLTQGRKLTQKLEEFQNLQVHTSDIERQLATKTAQAEQTSEQLKEAQAQITPATARIRELELQLAEANAKALAQEQIGDQLRHYLDKIAAGQGAATPSDVQK